jgi:hypothetical protein
MYEDNVAALDREQRELEKIQVKAKKTVMETEKTMNELSSIQRRMQDENLPALQNEYDEVDRQLIALREESRSIKSEQARATESISNLKKESDNSRMILRQLKNAQAELQEVSTQIRSELVSTTNEARKAIHTSNTLQMQQQIHNENAEDTTKILHVHKLLQELQKEQQKLKHIVLKHNGSTLFIDVLELQNHIAQLQTDVSQNMQSLRNHVPNESTRMFPRAPRLLSSMLKVESLPIPVSTEIESSVQVRAMAYPQDTLRKSIQRELMNIKNNHEKFCTFANTNEPKSGNAHDSDIEELKEYQDFMLSLQSKIFDITQEITEIKQKLLRFKSNDTFVEECTEEIKRIEKYMEEKSRVYEVYIQELETKIFKSNESQMIEYEINANDEMKVIERKMGELMIMEAKHNAIEVCNKVENNLLHQAEKLRDMSLSSSIHKIKSQQKLENIVARSNNTVDLASGYLDLVSDVMARIVEDTSAAKLSIDSKMTSKIHGSMNPDIVQNSSDAMEMIVEAMETLQLIHSIEELDQSELSDRIRKTKDKQKVKENKSYLESIMSPLRSATTMLSRSLFQETEDHTPSYEDLQFN